MGAFVKTAVIGTMAATAFAGFALAEDATSDDAPRYSVTALAYNDFFGDGKDRYLTGGVQATFAARQSDLFNEPLIGGDSYLIIQGGGRSYTPADISARNPAADDRPYAGYVYGSIGVARVTGADDALTQTTAQLEIGATGPMLGFEGIQNDIHDMMSLPKARGWDTEIGNEIYATVRAERMWRRFGSVGVYETEFAPFARVDVGMAENSATLGVEVAVGDRLGRGLKVRESALGASYAAIRTPDQDTAWRMYAGGDVKVVATDAVLDGGFFRDGRSVAKTTFRYRARAGFDIATGPVTIGYGVHLLGPEFEAQDDPQLVGAFTLTVRF
ncbi:MAG: lipid A deacylase LpxR family protein [Pseudomonadota bacterium]